MEMFIVYKNSCVAPIVEKLGFDKIATIRQLTRKETVEITFKNDWCRISAKHTKKVKVPNKAMSSTDNFFKWVEERINSAWK